MKILSVARLAMGAAIAVLLSSAALGQPAWTPASEILNQPVRVTTNGVSNTLTLSTDGRATIASPAGYIVQGTWSAPNGRLCLSHGLAQECWPYDAPFKAGQPVTLKSSCDAISTWLAAITNAPPPPSARSGERGR